MSFETDLKIIHPAAVRLRWSAGQLCATLSADEDYIDVSLVRAFPLSDPERYWGLLDQEGKDLGVIVDPSGLDAESLRTAREALERRYFIPVIERVVGTREDYGSIVWTVETDKGPRTFTVRNLKDSIVELGGPRLLVVDVDGNRYEIPDTHRLDPKTYDLILRSQ